MSEQMSRRAERAGSWAMVLTTVAVVLLLDAVTDLWIVWRLAIAVGVGLVLALVAAGIVGARERSGSA